MNQPAHARPVIHAGFRLQWEAVQNAHVLLYPEGMVKLNRSAGEILSRCTGALTFQQIVADVERQFERQGLQKDIENFLTMAQEKGWVNWVSDVGHKGDGRDED